MIYGSTADNCVIVDGATVGAINFDAAHNVLFARNGASLQGVLGGSDDDLIYVESSAVGGAIDAGFGSDVIELCNVDAAAIDVFGGADNDCLSTTHSNYTSLEGGLGSDDACFLYPPDAADASCEESGCFEGIDFCGTYVPADFGLPCSGAAQLECGADACLVDAALFPCQVGSPCLGSNCFVLDSDFAAGDFDMADIAGHDCLVVQSGGTVSSGKIQSSTDSAKCIIVLGHVEDGVSLGGGDDVIFFAGTTGGSNLAHVDGNKGNNKVSVIGAFVGGNVKGGDDEDSIHVCDSFIDSGKVQGGKGNDCCK